MVATIIITLSCLTRSEMCPGIILPKTDATLCIQRLASVGTDLDCIEGTYFVIATVYVDKVSDIPVPIAIRGK